MSITQKLIIFLNLFSLGLFVPVLNLIILEKSATLQTLPLFIAIYSGTILLFELPSGICADLFGRKVVFLISCLFQLTSFFLLLIGYGTLCLSIVMILNGLGRAFSSGSLDALFIDQAIEKNGEAALSKITSTLAVLEGIGLTVGSILGGILSSVGNTFYYNILLRIIITIAVIILNFFYVKEVRSFRKEKESKLPVSFPFLFKKKQKTKFFSARLLLVFLGMYFTGCFLISIETYWQPAFKDISDLSGRTWLLGIISFLGFGAGTLGNIIIGKVLYVYKDKWWGLFGICRFLFGGFVIIFAFQKGTIGFILGYTVIYLLLGVSNVTESTIINILIPKQLRASFLSLGSFATQIGALSASLLNSILITRWHFTGLWALFGILLMGYSVLVLVILLLKKNIGREPEYCNLVDEMDT
jgi:MFS family permease